MEAEYPQQYSEQRDMDTYHAQVTAILRSLSVEYFAKWPGEKERLMSFQNLSARKQIDYEQDVVIRAIGLEDIKQQAVEKRAFRFGRYLHWREYQAIQDQKDILETRVRELHQKLVTREEVLQDASGIWKGSLLPQEYFGNE